MKEFLSRQLSRKGLFERRRTLEDSIPIRRAERRDESRLEAPEHQPSPFSTTGVLLNLSESGFAVEVPQKCRVARGEAHRLNLKVGSGRVEVDGEVRWTRSIWKDLETSSQTSYRQIAGFEILESVSEDTLSILGIMRGMVESSMVAVEVGESQILDRIKDHGRNMPPRVDQHD